jgi:hypothetical protein
LTTHKELLEVTIGLDGSIQARTIGIKGKKCLQTISELEDLLDAQTVDSSYTTEYYEEFQVNKTSEGVEDVAQ